MANISKTEEVKITEVVEKLVEPNSKCIANDGEHINTPYFPPTHLHELPEIDWHEGEEFPP